MVGRESELRLLKNLLSGVASGYGNLALISGEAGIGKTTLATTIMSEAGEMGMLRLSGRCFDLVATPPYGCWLEALSSGPADAGPPPVTTTTQQQSDSQEASNPDALFTRFIEYLSDLCQKQPIVILLDDIHWADTASLDLIRHLARRISTLPILMLTTYRSEEVNRRHVLYTMLPALVREASARRIELRRLDDVAVADWVTRRYQFPEIEGRMLVSYLQRHAQGNPFFAGEILRTLEDHEALFRDGSGWRLGGLDDIRIPLLLRQVIEGRLARISEESRQLLSLAAIIGEQLDVALWQRVAEVDEDEFLSAIEDATEAGLLTMPSDGLTVQFDHALIRETLYEGVYPLRRRGWHRRIAEILLDSPRPDAEAIAFHFHQASDARAGEWLIHAGDLARSAHALNASFDRYEAAFQILETSGAGPAPRGWLLLRLADTRVWLDERQGLSYLEEAGHIADAIDDRALRTAVLWHRGKFRIMAGDNGLPDLEASISLLDQLQPDEHSRLSGLLVRGYTAKAGQAFAVRTLASYYAHYGHYQESLALAERLLNQEPLQAGEEELYEALALSYSATGRPDEARWAFGNTRDIVRGSQRFADLANITRMELRDAALIYHPDRLSDLNQLAEEIEQAYRKSIAHGTVSNVSPRWGILPLLFLHGYWNETLAIAREALDRGGIWKRTTSPVRTMLARHQGDRELAWSLVREALPLGPASEPDNQYFDSVLSLQRLAAELALDVGDHETAHAWLEAHERWLTQSGRVQGRSELALLRARYHLTLGDREDARAQTAQALDLASAPRQPLPLLAAHRVLGELDTLDGCYPVAESHLDEAIRLADACAAPFERALTMLARAKLLIARGETGVAAELLSPARDILELLGAAPALDTVEHLREQVSIGPINVGTKGEFEGLTGREVDVLRLVADGLTDAEVAHQLGISHRTVSNHLRSIYTKLAVSSRTAATRLAVEQKLL